MIYLDKKLTEVVEIIDNKKVLTEIVDIYVIKR